MAERFESPPTGPAASLPSLLEGEGREGGIAAAHSSRRPAGAPQDEEDGGSSGHKVRGDSRASKHEEKQRPRHPEKVNRPDSPVQRKPDWIRVKAPVSREYQETRALMRRLKLNTVC